MIIVVIFPNVIGIIINLEKRVFARYNNLFLSPKRKGGLWVFCHQHDDFHDFIWFELLPNDPLQEFSQS